MFRKSDSAQHAPILVGILGLLIAVIQGLTAFGHFVALWFSREGMKEAFPDSQPSDITAHDYLRGAAYASLNLALAAICIASIFIAMRSGRRGSTMIPWACLGIVVVTALLTFTGRTSLGESL